MKKSMFAAAIEHAAPVFHLDAGETAAFTRQLEAIAGETYNVMYATAKARRWLSTVGGVGPAHDSYTYRQFDKLGEWKAVHDFAVDFPTVEIEGREFTTGIKSFGASYAYSVMDLRQSALMNVSLDSERAAVVRERFEALVDRLSCVGDLDLSIKGLANASNITDLTSTVTNDWTSSATTEADILADVDLMRQQIFNDSLGEWTGGYRMLLPTAVYSALNTRRIAPGFASPMSMIQFILASSPDISSIDHWARLDTAGTASAKRVLMMVDSPRVAQLLIPQEFEQFAPQVQGMAFKVPCHGRCGGVVVRYPKGIVFTDGVAS